MRGARSGGGRSAPSQRLAESRIRVGVVGLGVFGGHHARHYAAHPDAELVAVVDADPARREAAAEKYGAAALGDYRDLHRRVHAVSIAVPARHHHAITMGIVAAGIHVLVEKPLAVTAAEGRDIAALAKETGAVVAVGHVERFSPVTEALRARITRPRRIAAVRRSVWSGRSTDVDVVLDLMIHDIDLVLTLSQAPLASVAASGVAGPSGAIDEAEAWLTFADGLVATLSASRVAAANSRTLSITEPDAAYVADLGTGRLAVATRSRWKAPPEEIALELRDNLGAEIADFLAAIAERREPMTTAEQGIAAVEVANRIQASIADSARREAM